MRNQVRALFVILALILVTSGARAADGSSGCGPGWYILKDNSLVSSALRAITNGILWPVTTIGMTVGTSNCTQHKLVLKEKESLYFATQNHFELKSDIAKGQGEYLSAFAATIGCPASTQGRFNQMMRANFSSTYPDGRINPENVLVETYKTILKDQVLTNKCSLGAA